MNNQKLSVVEFGKQLIATKDLDPVYVLLYAAELPHSKLCDWLLAYFCFYHCGTASWIADASGIVGDRYFDRLAAAARNAEHPRGSERRHFRGEQANKAVAELRATGLAPGGIIGRIIRGEGNTLAEVMGRVKELRGFGDWIAFKVADIVERLGLAQVEFKPEDIFNMYSEPRKGADLVWAAHSKRAEQPTDYMWVYGYLKKRLEGLKAPPRYERDLNIQEIETILCKFKSHTNGHYPVGKDIKEIKHALERYKHTRTANKLIAAGHKGGLW